MKFRHYRHSDGQRRFVFALVVVHLIHFSQISSMTRDALADKALAWWPLAGGLSGNSRGAENRQRKAAFRRSRRSGEPA
ncbi:hypothetical protein KCP71_03900 [Salmonella enterica subsp. enterica]|nr:hypothetical protein KCP71_03900 [Salmonella enterica subsp. enterica]